MRAERREDFRVLFRLCNNSPIWLKMPIEKKTTKENPKNFRERPRGCVRLPPHVHRVLLLQTSVASHTFECNLHCN